MIRLPISSMKIVVLFRLVERLSISLVKDTARLFIIDFRLISRYNFIFKLKESFCALNVLRRLLDKII